MARTPRARWVCPECEYAPKLYQTRPNADFMYDTRDAIRNCARYLALLSNALTWI